MNSHGHSSLGGGFGERSAFVNYGAAGRSLERALYDGLWGPRRRRPRAVINKSGPASPTISTVRERGSIVQKAAELARARGMLQLAERLCLDLADAFTRH
jgi:hypothetical protein